MKQATIRILAAAAALAFTGCGNKPVIRSSPAAMSQAHALPLATLADDLPSPAAAAPRAHWFVMDNHWGQLGSILHSGGQRSYQYGVFARTVSHLLLEAPTYCAPSVTHFGVSTHPLAGLQAVQFIGQRMEGTMLRAIYRVTAGQPVLINGIAIGFSGPLAACRINIYAAVW